MTIRQSKQKLSCNSIKIDVEFIYFDYEIAKIEWYILQSALKTLMNSSNGFTIKSNDFFKNGKKCVPMPKAEFEKLKNIPPADR